MGLFLHRVMALVALGLLAGVVHSCASPPKLHPDNNPESVEVPADTKPATGSDPGEPKWSELTHKPAEAPVKPAETPKVDPPTNTQASKPAPNYFITVERAKELWDRGQK